MAEKKPESATGKETRCAHESRRDFLKQTSLLTGVALTPAAVLKAAEDRWDEGFASSLEKMPPCIKFS